MPPAPLRILFAAIISIAISSTAVAEESLAYTAYELSDSAACPTTANHAYRLLAPEPVQPGEKLPLVLYLHGAGSKGDDNLKQTTEPLPKLLAEKKVSARFRCLVLVPQCRDGNDAQGRPNNWVKWEGQALNPPAQWLRSERETSDQLLGARAALQDVLARQPVDTTRIYLTGVSMGGSGTWWWAAQEPEQFTAVVAACGLSETTKAPALAKIPAWVFHGTDDAIAPVERSRAMVEAVRAAGGTIRFTEYTGVGHGIAERVFRENDYDALTWLFVQRRSPAP